MSLSRITYSSFLWDTLYKLGGEPCSGLFHNVWSRLVLDFPQRYIKMESGSRSGRSFDLSKKHDHISRGPISRSDHNCCMELKRLLTFWSILYYDNIQTNKYRHFDNSRYKLCKIRLFKFGWRPRHLAALGINKICKHKTL